MRYHDKQTSNDMMKVYFVRAVSCRLTYIDIDTATTPRRCRCAFFESAFRDRRQQTASKNRKTEMKSKWKQKQADCLVSQSFQVWLKILITTLLLNSTAGHFATIRACRCEAISTMKVMKHCLALRMFFAWFRIYCIAFACLHNTGHWTSYKCLPTRWFKIFRGLLQVILTAYSWL